MKPERLFAALLSYPGSSGEVRDLAPAVDALHRHGALAIVATDLLALAPLKPPGEFGATSRSARRSASACRWAMAGRMRRSSPPAMPISDRCRGASSGFPSMPRPAGAAHGAADARAAYPAGEGDEQYLHGAGAAGGGCLDVRRLHGPEG